MSRLTITAVESLHADAGWRTYDFLKITTEGGLVGWSEYNEFSAGRASPPSSTAWPRPSSARTPEPTRPTWP